LLRPLNGKNGFAVNFRQLILKSGEDQFITEVPETVIAENKDALHEISLDFLL